MPARKRTSRRAAPQSWDAPAEQHAEPDQVAPDPLPPDRIENVNGQLVEVRRLGAYEYVRPPSFEAIGLDGKPYTVRPVASAWYLSVYKPWLIAQRGGHAPEPPEPPAAPDFSDELLPTDEEDL